MTEVNYKKIKFFNNIFFYISAGYALYLLIKTNIERAKLPEGVCPIENNNDLFYIAIGLLVISFIANVIIDLMNRKQKKIN